MGGSISTAATCPQAELFKTGVIAGEIPECLLAVDASGIYRVCVQLKNYPLPLSFRKAGNSQFHGISVACFETIAPRPSGAKPYGVSTMGSFVDIPVALEMYSACTGKPGVVVLVPLLPVLWCILQQRWLKSSRPLWGGLIL